MLTVKTSNPPAIALNDLITKLQAKPVPVNKLVLETGMTYLFFRDDVNSLIDYQLMLLDNHFMIYHHDTSDYDDLITTQLKTTFKHQLVIKFDLTNAPDNAKELFDQYKVNEESREHFFNYRLKKSEIGLKIKIYNDVQCLNELNQTPLADDAKPLTNYPITSRYFNETNLKYLIRSNICRTFKMLQYLNSYLV